MLVDEGLLKCKSEANNIVVTLNIKSSKRLLLNNCLQKVINMVTELID